MSKAWRVVMILILVLFVAGIVCGGIGLLTGASLDRMVENVFGGWEALEAMLDVLLGELNEVAPGQYGVSIVN